MTESSNPRGKSRTLARRILRGVLLVALGWIVVSVGCVVLLRWVNPSTSAFILRDRFIAWKSNDNKFVYHREWVDLKHIAQPMQLAVIASEDQKFPIHHGFDLASINRALEERDSGHHLRGASTITQQVAKNLFLWPGQSWMRKGIEAYFTVLIETCWPKRRILEVYLNSAEFGRGVYGAEAAARTYYRKSASQLNAYDAALLAAVLPSPKRFKAAAPSFYVRSRQHWIIEQMQDLGGTTYLQSLK